MKLFVLALKVVYYCLAITFVVVFTIGGYEVGTSMIESGMFDDSFYSNPNKYSMLFGLGFFLVSLTISYLAKKILNVICRVLVKE